MSDEGLKDHFEALEQLGVKFDIDIKSVGVDLGDLEIEKEDFEEYTASLFEFPSFAKDKDVQDTINLDDIAAFRHVLEEWNASKKLPFRVVIENDNTTNANTMNMKVEIDPEVAKVCDSSASSPVRLEKDDTGKLELPVMYLQKIIDAIKTDLLGKRCGLPSWIRQLYLPLLATSDDEEKDIALGELVDISEDGETVYQITPRMIDLCMKTGDIERQGYGAVSRSKHLEKFFQDFKVDG